MTCRRREPEQFLQRGNQVVECLDARFRLESPDERVGIAGQAPFPGLHRLEFLDALELCGLSIWIVIPVLVR